MNYRSAFFAVVSAVFIVGLVCGLKPERAALVAFGGVALAEAISQREG
jgi:hypothetical protein